MKLTIPTDTSEITLGQLQRLTEIEEAELDNLEKQKQTIELLTGVDRGTLNRFRLSDLEGVYDKLLYLSKQDNRLIKFVTLEGVKYGFHPNLSNITTGEFADLDTFCKDLNKNLHYIMAVLYRPVTTDKSGKYDIEPYKGTEARAELFKNKLPANVVNGAMVFFWTLGRDYLKDILRSSSEGKAQTSNKDSVKNGDGMLSS